MQTECQCPQKKSETSEKVPGTTRKNCKKTVVFFSLFPLSFNDEAQKPTFFRIKASLPMLMSTQMKAQQENIYGYLLQKMKKIVF